jgi:hypothetical protein
MKEWHTLATQIHRSFRDRWPNPEAGGGFRSSWQRGLLIAWVGVSATALFLCALPFVIPVDTLLSLSAWARAPHPEGSCLLCGATGSLVLVAEGQLQRGLWANPFIGLLYSVTWLNIVGIALWLMWYRGEPKTEKVT